MATFRLIAGIAALTVLIVVQGIRERLRLKAIMPPGPKLAWSGLGDNKGEMPRHETWKTFSKWHAQYGPVVSAIVGLTRIIVLGTVKAASDLLEKRSNIYSSRPREIISGEIYSGSMRGIGMPYSQRWRNWRSLIHAGLSTESAKKYKPQQSLEVIIILKDLMDEKESKQVLALVRR